MGVICKRWLHSLFFLLPFRPYLTRPSSSCYYCTVQGGGRTLLLASMRFQLGIWRGGGGDTTSSHLSPQIQESCGTFCSGGDRKEKKLFFVIYTGLCGQVPTCRMKFCGHRVAQDDLLHIRIFCLSFRIC